MADVSGAKGRSTSNIIWRDAAAPASRGLTETPSQLRFQTIYHIVRERITLLQYPPGTILDIDALAAEFDVSRTPVRSVLQQLSYHGLVFSRHGVRTSVARIDFEQVREATALRSHLAELIGILSPLEPGPAAIETMAQAEADCLASIDRPDLELFARIDIKVHEAICSLIGNGQLKQAYDDLYYRAVRAWFYLLPELEWREEASIFHRDIAARLDTMRRGDTKAVGFLTRNAISAVLVRLDSLIARLEKGADPDGSSLAS